MIVIISPSKTLDYQTLVSEKNHSMPDFLSESEQLLSYLRQYSPDQLCQKMSISMKLASLNVQRFQNWHQPFTLDNARQAVFAFKGDVYNGLEAASLSTDELAWAQHHLRIVSGLYGLLKPLDLIQPYRLEMGTKLRTSRGSNLYQFWQSSLTETLNQQLTVGKSTALVNLASNEYSKAVNFTAVEVPVITPVFKDWKNGRYKIISFFAKKARGMMCSWIIRNKITDGLDLQQFNSANYRYSAEDSSSNQPVFLRKQ